MSTQKIHEGRNVKRIREILQVKQEVLADALGISQQSVSLLEQRETIDPETLEQVAKSLKVPVEAIKNYNEEATVNNIACNFSDNAVGINYMPVFNPFEKWLEAMEENKRLYEALLQSEREKDRILEKALDKK